MIESLETVAEKDRIECLWKLLDYKNCFFTKVFEIYFSNIIRDLLIVQFFDSIFK